MSEYKQKVEFDFLPLAIVLAFIFFLGEPDLHDALIRWLMR